MVIDDKLNKLLAKVQYMNSFHDRHSQGEIIFLASAVSVYKDKKWRLSKAPNG